jgi:hypothetical protein
MVSDKSGVVQYWNGGRGFGFIAPDVRDSSSGKGSAFDPKRTLAFKAIYFLP